MALCLQSRFMVDVRRYFVNKKRDLISEICINILRFIMFAYLTFEMVMTENRDDKTE